MDKRTEKRLDTLYQIVVDNCSSKVPDNQFLDNWYSRRYIVDLMLEQGYYTTVEREDNSPSHQLIDDVKLINANSNYAHIIVYKNNKLKVATEEEAKEYMSHFMKKACIQLKHYWDLQRKISTNNQGNMKFEDGVVEYIDRFSKEFEKEYVNASENQKKDEAIKKIVDEMDLK